MTQGLLIALGSSRSVASCNPALTPLTTTRHMQDVFILKNLKLYDSPGIVASPSNPPASMALRSLQVEEEEETVLEAVRTLLKQCDKIQVRRLGLEEGTRHWPDSKLPFVS